jgi:hypothetical protein
MYAQCRTLPRDRAARVAFQGRRLAVSLWSHATVQYICSSWPVVAMLDQLHFQLSIY